MKKLLLGIFLISFQLSYAALGPVPVVPATIEIAGVKLKLTSDARREIQKEVNALRASDKYFGIKLDRVNLYFPIIERVLKEEGVPEDIKYLSIQESALISDAVSSADAVGYWQFKDFTAREVGLRVDGKIDERKNIVSATHGAAQYFKRNNFFFKNWIYCVSAYQAGPAGAKRYTDESNYGSDKLTITSKSHWYVLRYIAHVIAFKDEVGKPHSEGLKLLEYTKGKGKSLDEIARNLKIEEDLLADYNKWLKHGRIPDDKEYAVIIPVKGKVPKNLEENNDPPPLTRSIEKSEPVKYPDQIASSITKGSKAIFIKINGIEAVMAGNNDNIVNLALKAGINSDKLIKYNDLKPGQQIIAGEIYYTRHKKNRSPIRYHVTQYNESLWDISQKYGIKLNKLIKKNRMTEGELPEPGRVMWLYKTRPKDSPIEYHKVTKPEPAKQPVVVKKEPVKKEPDLTSENPITTQGEEQPKEIVEIPEPINETLEEKPVSVNGKVIHVVQPGETLWAIARLYAVSVDDIINWNGLATGTLSVGQELIIDRKKSTETVQEQQKELALEPDPSESITINEEKEPITEEETPAENQKELTETTHEVQPGESLWGISRKYDVSVDDIIQWNNLPTGNISPGQILKITTSSSTLKKEINDQNDSEPENVSQPDVHEVQPGESLWAIAKKYNVSIEALKEWNGLTDTSINVGEKLLLKSPPPIETKAPKYDKYIVKGGDSLYKIAREHNMTVEELMELNRMESTSLSVGQQLKVKRK